MESILIVGLAVLGLSVGALAFLIFRLMSRLSQPQDGALLIQQQLQSLREETTRTLHESARLQNDRLSSVTQQLNDRMKETSSVLNTTQESVGQRLDNAARVVGQLQQKLGNLEESSKRIFELGQGLSEIKDILKSPKLRGNMGEFFLEDLLRQILPPDRWKVQHQFRTGETVDAVILLGPNLVPLDSKFPLESFLRLQKIPDDQPDLRKKEKKEFVAAIKKHADSIAKKYILPNEGTFEFALMYIPAENIYYETIIRDDVMEEEGSLYRHLLDKKVVPVSPNSLYAYLQVIVLGLKGMRIEEHAQQISRELGRLGGELTRFRDDYEKLGKHLKNASGSFEEGARRLDRFEQRWQSVAEGEQNPALPHDANP